MANASSNEVPAQTPEGPDSTGKTGHHSAKMVSEAARKMRQGVQDSRLRGSPLAEQTPNSTASWGIERVLSKLCASCKLHAQTLRRTCATANVLQKPQHALDVLLASAGFILRLWLCVLDVLFERREAVFRFSRFLQLKICGPAFDQISGLKRWIHASEASSSLDKEQHNRHTGELVAVSFAHEKMRSAIRR
ncbi:hypothetical protein M433DRAFT_545604 [Acidomyces richmondensis BFW]|nr:hypothetical protein M433DRAFT_545604 [Acidomyces richmondensis BFW]